MTNFSGRQEGDKDYRTPLSRQGLGDILRYLFNTNGKRMSPPEIDVDTIKTVYDFGAGGYSQYEIQSAQTANSSIAGAGSVGTVIVSPNIVFPLGIQTNKARSPDNNPATLGVGPGMNWETRLINLMGTLTFDAAGALAANGLTLDLSLIITNISGGIGQILYRNKGAIQIKTANLVYDLNYLYTIGNLVFNVVPMSTTPFTFWNKHIPKGFVLQANLAFSTGVAFPANTTLQYNSMAILVPEGVQLPD